MKHAPGSELDKRNTGVGSLTATSAIDTLGGSRVWASRLSGIRRGREVTRALLPRIARNTRFPASATSPNKKGTARPTPAVQVREETAPGGAATRGLQIRKPRALTGLNF